MSPCDTALNPQTTHIAPRAKPLGYLTGPR